MRRVALEVKALLDELGLQGWAKTSGSARDARERAHRAAVGVRRRPPCSARPVARDSSAARRSIATSKWWKEERRGVFLDYNQNAKDRTTCAAYSVRPLPDARVSAPLRWDEVPDCDPADFTVATMPSRFAAMGDPHANMDGAAGSLENCSSSRRATRRRASATHRGLRTFARRPARPRASRPHAPAVRSRSGRARVTAVTPPTAATVARPPRAPRSGRRARLPRAPRPGRHESRRCRCSRSRTRRTRTPPSPASSAGRRKHRRPPGTSRWTTSSSTRCAVVHRRGPASASTCATFRKTSGLPQETPDPDDDPTREWRRRSHPGASKKPD